jgi:hypothetical protein
MRRIFSALSMSMTAGILLLVQIPAHAAQPARTAQFGSGFKATPVMGLQKTAGPPAAARAGTGSIHGFVYNETTRTLTLKAKHLYQGCWQIEPTKSQIAPGSYATWAATGACGGVGEVSEGYVTYTVAGTGGQGYAYMWWNHTPYGNSSGGQAGGLFTVERTRLGDEASYHVRCLSSAC